MDLRDKIALQIMRNSCPLTICVKILVSIALMGGHVYQTQCLKDIWVENKCVGNSMIKRTGTTLRMVAIVLSRLLGLLG